MPTRPETLDRAPMHYAPENELGVVFLFAELARRWRLRVEKIRPGFPDCIAYQKIDGGERKIRIESEFRSRNFAQHKHKARCCDWLVCWEHNWPAVPPRLRVVELRREFGLGFNVWIQPVGGEYKDVLCGTNRASSWTVPSRARHKDLLLYYHNRPEKQIKDLFLLDGPVRYVTAGFKPGKDYMGPIRRVCGLAGPVHLDDMRQHPVLCTANFVRARMRGRPNVTEYWPYLFEMIIKRNPALRRTLRPFEPANLR